MAHKKLVLHWRAAADETALLYYPGDMDEAGAVRDPELASRICQRYNALVGFVDYDALHEFLDRVGKLELPDYERKLLQRALGVES